MCDGNQRHRDEAIAEDLRDLLEHDRRLESGKLAVCVRGGVVHLGGQVASEGERELVRMLARHVRGVLAVWDTADRDDGSPLRRVDIGCGTVKQDAGAIGIDVYRAPAADIVADLDLGLPFADSSIDRIFAVHVLEHVRDLFGVLNELHRVLAPGGVLHLMVPHADHVNAVADPTHVRFFNLQTIKYFCRPQHRLLPWWPLMAATDGASVFADLRPIAPGREAPEAVLARWFD